MRQTMGLSERKIDDLCICFYGGEPLLKTRIIYKIMDMFPKAKFVFQVEFVALSDVDERHAPEDGEAGLPPSCGHDPVFSGWSSRDDQSLSRQGNVRAHHGERGLHQERRLRPRHRCAYDGVDGAERRHLRGCDASHQRGLQARPLAAGLQLGHPRRKPHRRVVSVARRELQPRNHEAGGRVRAGVARGEPNPPDRSVLGRVVQVRLSGWSD